MALVSTAEATKFFKDVDTSGDGCITIQELKAKMGNSMSGPQVANMFRDVDDDGDKKITLKEFIDDVCKPARRKGLEEAFKAADKDGSDSLSKDEISHILAKAGATDQASIDSVLCKVDSDGSGQISMNEFLDWMDENY